MGDLLGNVISHHSHTPNMARAAKVLEKMKELFDAMDTDGNGVLDREEVKNGIRKMAAIMGQSGGAEQVEEAVKAIFGELDANADGRISFEEIHTAINDKAPPGQKLEDLDSIPEEEWEMMRGMMKPMMEAAIAAAKE